ncbi:hypothetical protein B0H15DRAFT_806931 [Mycena belliarum]|uniref:Uncharacterized protein n=1 Tax=Mycena belliarum TaxID=1033014 RepID=A0AAD6XIH0_9AGAR|nr:hypothetical protein B0H15DRAFT_806931 [Mycena belliae]
MGTAPPALTPTAGIPRGGGLSLPQAGLQHPLTRSARQPLPDLGRSSTPSAPPLPYTGPPAPNQRPRYAGRPLPDLSLPPAGSGYTNTSFPQATMVPIDPQYHSAPFMEWAVRAPQPPPTYQPPAPTNQAFDFHVAADQDYFNHVAGDSGMEYSQTPLLDPRFTGGFADAYNHRRGRS